MSTDTATFIERVTIAGDIIRIPTQDDPTIPARIEADARRFAAAPHEAVYRTRLNPYQLAARLQSRQTAEEFAYGTLFTPGRQHGPEHASVYVQRGRCCD